MNRFTSTAQRDGRWWVVQCDQEPGAISQVARLDQAAEYQCEAISMVTDIPEDEIEVTINPVLDSAAADLIERAKSDRAKADELAKAAAEANRAAARELAASGYSMRDVGFMLGVSYQRAHQLVAS